jgi:YegS/Rv2252/BmrU family lipid kinase
MKKLLFVFNPRAGKAQIPGRIFDIINYYTQQGYLVTVYPTQMADDGRSYVQEMDEHYDMIICSGGDGTLNEIISGILLSQCDCVLGYIPSGSTNDFGRSLGLPMNIEEAMKITCHGEAKAIDVGLLNNQYFVYVAAFGVFTDVAYATPQDMKNTFGYLAYILQGIKSLTELRTYAIEMEYDGNIVKDDFIVGLVMNSFSIAGFKNPLGAATELDDGLFEILMVRLPKNIIELQAIVTSLLSEKVDSQYMLYAQASHIKIKSEPIEWTLDGEYGGRFEAVDITNCHKAIRMIGE